MNLGLFMMPLHRPGKPWGEALREDGEAVLLAEKLGFSEVWVGEHFSTKAEQIPSPLMFLATLIGQTARIRLGTGVINLPYHHPVVVAAEAALFDQLSDGRLILGVGPSGLVSDAELFGREDMAERYAMMSESIELMIKVWTESTPFRFAGEHFRVSLENKIWQHAGVGEFARSLQQPHPPIALAMVGPGGPTAKYIAANNFIPISANFVPIDNLVSQWQIYAATRDELDKPADPSIWRVCRNILITDSDAEAGEELANPDGTLAFYFRYLRGVRRIDDIQSHPQASVLELNRMLEVEQALEDCVIAGSVTTVLERLIDLVDLLGPFGTLVTVGHDWEPSGRWPRSMQRLAEDVMPRLAQHVGTL